MTALPKRERPNMVQASHTNHSSDQLVTGLRLPRCAVSRCIDVCVIETKLLLAQSPLRALLVLGPRGQRSSSHVKRLEVWAQSLEQKYHMGEML